MFFGLLTPVSHARSIVDGLLVDAPSCSVIERAGAKMQADLRTFPATRLDCCVHGVIPTASSLPLLECVSVDVRNPFCAVPRQTPDSPEISLESYLTSLYIRVSTTVLNRPDPNLDIMPLALNSVPVTDPATWTSLRQSIINALCNPVVATRRHEAVDDMKPGTILGVPIAGTIQELAYEESSLTRVDVAINLGIDAKSTEESVPYPPLVPLHMNTSPNTAFLLCLVGGALCMFQVATTFIRRGETIHAPPLEHVNRNEPQPRFATIHFYTDGRLPRDVPLDTPPLPPVVVTGSKEWHMNVCEHRLEDIRRFLKSIGKRYNLPFEGHSKQSLWNCITIAFIKLSERKVSELSIKELGFCCWGYPLFRLMSVKNWTAQDVMSFEAFESKAVKDFARLRDESVNIVDVFLKRDLTARPKHGIMQTRDDRTDLVMFHVKAALTRLRHRSVENIIEIRHGRPKDPARKSFGRRRWTPTPDPCEFETAAPTSQSKPAFFEKTGTWTASQGSNDESDSSEGEHSLPKDSASWSAWGADEPKTASAQDGSAIGADTDGYDGLVSVRITHDPKDARMKRLLTRQDSDIVAHTDVSVQADPTASAWSDMRNPSGGLGSSNVAEEIVPSELKSQEVSDSKEEIVPSELKALEVSDSNESECWDRVWDTWDEIEDTVARYRVMPDVPETATPQQEGATLPTPALALAITPLGLWKEAFYDHVENAEVFSKHRNKMVTNSDNRAVIDLIPYKTKTAEYVDDLLVFGNVRTVPLPLLAQACLNKFRVVHDAYPPVTPAEEVAISTGCFDVERPIARNLLPTSILDVKEWLYKTKGDLPESVTFDPDSRIELVSVFELGLEWTIEVAVQLPVFNPSPFSVLFGHASGGWFGCGNFQLPGLMNLPPVDDPTPTKQRWVHYVLVRCGDSLRIFRDHFLHQEVKQVHEFPKMIQHIGNSGEGHPFGAFAGFKFWSYASKEFDGIACV